MDTRLKIDFLLIPIPDGGRVIMTVDNYASACPPSRM